ncbi:MAG: PilN domain-containing protein, partial [Candidatus Omnitrophica bacterium]|nr:PilN domain-containing protein [Candidatus Omnitrophota bacterium]
YLDSKLGEVGPVARKVEDTTKKMELIRDQLDYSNSGIDVIYELYNILPSSMSLNVFNLDEKGDLTLQGVSNQMSDIFSFQSKLEKSKNFKNVEVKYASKRMTSQGEVTDFRITCQVGKE